MLTFLLTLSWLFSKNVSFLGKNRGNYIVYIIFDVVIGCLFFRIGVALHDGKRDCAERRTLIASASMCLGALVIIIIQVTVDGQDRDSSNEQALLLPSWQYVLIVAVFLVPTVLVGLVRCIALMWHFHDYGMPS